MLELVEISLSRVIPKQMIDVDRTSTWYENTSSSLFQEQSQNSSIPRIATDLSVVARADSDMLPYG